MNKGILIDMGGTLIHTKNMDFTRSLNFIYDNAHSKGCTKEEYINYGLKLITDIFNKRKYIEVRLIDFIKLINETLHVKINYTLEDLEVLFAEKCSDISKVKDVDKVLKYFKNKGYKIVVLSNTCFSRRAIISLLGDLNQYFDEVIASSECMVRKPYEAFFELGISKFDLKRDEIYYIGNDFYFDIYGSTRANLKSIWLNEDNKEYDKSLGARNFIIINNYQELIDKGF